MPPPSNPAPGLTLAQKRALLAQLLLEQGISALEPTGWNLSYGQQAMWFNYQLAPHNPAYNVAFTARIVSEPDVDAMRRAFQALVDRHAMLRTTFDPGVEQPVQHVHAQLDVAFEQVDAAGWSQTELRQRVEAAYQCPFDLGHGPVLRVSLFSQAAADHVLLLAAHHIVVDGWTLGILLDEFRMIYAAECAGVPAALPPVGAEYVDFVRWQADMLRGPEGDRLKAYWQHQLAPPLPILELPTDRPRPARQTFRGGTHKVELDEPLTHAVKELARSERTTLYTVMLAAFAVVLHRWTGQDELVLGSPTAGRDRAAFAGVVGDFVDMQVLRLDSSGGPTFRVFLARMRQTVLDALEHQGYPFTALIEQLPLEHPAGRSRVYQVGFDLQRLPRGGDLADLLIGADSKRVTIGGLVMQSFAIPQQQGQLDLMLQCVEIGGRLVGGLKFNTDLFDESTIARLAHEFRSLVATIAADADQPIDPDKPPVVDPEQDLAGFLASLRRLDVNVWLDGERLRVNAPAGTLTTQLQAAIGRRKAELVDLLRSAEQAVLDPGPAAIVPVARDGRLPLSFSQQRLWFMDQYEPGNAAYNIPIALRLRGQLNVAVLKLSIEAIVQRHESLRTRYVIRDGQAAQLIEPTGPVELDARDLRDLPASERLEEALRLAREECAQPFDLQVAPMLRCALVQLADDDHAIIVVIHHIAADAWSLGVLGRELTVLYAAFLHHRPAPLSPLPIQYADFAAWQRAWLVGDRLQHQLAYWTRTLAGPLPVLELPTDRPRPAIRSSRGGRQTFMLDTRLVDEMTTFSRGESATLFMSLLATFKTLLYRSTRQEDILVGTPVAGRDQEETQGLIGLFVNNLVLRTDLSGDPTFRQLVARVRNTSLEAMAHQAVPFDKLVEVLQPDRNSSRPPLFQVLFSLQNVPLQEPELSGLSVEVLQIDVGTSRYDLTFELYQRPSGLELSVEYNTDLFDVNSIRRFAGQYENLLRAALLSPDAPISELPLLAEADRQQLVVDWNRTQAEYPRQAGVHHLIEQQVARTPDRVAVVFAERSITYGELNQRANQLARHLQQLGVGPETIVGVCVERSIDMVVALLGIVKAGGSYLPLDPHFPTERLSYMLEDAGVDVLVTQQPLVGVLATVQTRLVCLDTDWPSIAEQPAEDLSQLAVADRVAYILYTSGSTGRPKGVQVLHRGLVNFLLSMRQRPGLSADDVLLSVTTLSFDIAGLELFLPLICGARVVLVSSAVAADGPALLQAVLSSSATVMQATPATWRLLLEAGWARTPDLRVLCGGEALSADLAAQLVARAECVWNLYGPTETTIWSTIHPVTLSGEASVPIGRPIANTRVYVLDAHRQVVPINVPGELYIGGDGVARGYLNRPELTAERFVVDPFSLEANARLYRSGDVVRWRADGNLEYLERIDTQVKIRGYRIELGEIEAVLEQDPSVRQAVVVVREDVPGDKRLVGYVAPAGAAGVSVPTLRERLKANLPAYMLPAVLVTLEHVPLTLNGKVDRNALPAPTEDRSERTSRFVAPRTQVERDIVQIWRDVLKLDEVGIDDNFFDLGGHSLLILQVHSRIRALYASDLTVAQMFEYPTVGALAEHVQQPLQASSSTNLQQAQERGQRLRVELDRLRRTAADRRSQT